MSDFDKFLEQKDKRELSDFRLAEQAREQDYFYEESGAIELCLNCRSRIN